MADLSLDTILSQANSFMTQAASSGNELFDISMRQAVLASDDANSARTVGINNEIIDRAKTSAELATQNAKIKGANALGTNLKDSGEVLTKLSGNILGLMTEKDQALRVVREKQSVGLLDDPLAYILNQISLPDDIAKHNAINEELQANQANMETLNRLTQSTSITQNQLLESVTVAAANASANNTLEAAKLAANKSTRDALGYNAQGVQTALTVSKEILGVQFQSQSAIMAQKHMDIALANLDLHRQEFDWRKEEKKLVDAARDKNTDADKFLMSRVNDGLKRMGLAEIPDTSSKAGNILAMIKSGAAAGSVYETALKIANDTEMAGGNTILAPSPSAAVELFHKLPGLKISPAQEPVRDLLRLASQSVVQKANTPGSTINLKDPRQAAAAVDSEARTILATQASNIVPGDKSNVFQVPDIASMITASPEIQKLPVVQKLLVPAVAAGADLNDPNKLFSMVTKGIRDGIITYGEGLELTSIYQRSVKVNLEAKQFQSLGLNLSPKGVADPSMFTYRTQITTSPSGTLFSGKQIVDMTNPFDLGRALNKFLSEQAAVNFQGRSVRATGEPGVYKPTMETQRPILDTLFGPPGGTP